MTDAKTTLPQILWPLMDRPSIEFDPPHCAICGSTHQLERHHIVRRGAGERYLDGRKQSKPLVMLCSRCHHELAHGNRLHFRWVPSPKRKTGEWVAYGAGHWEFALFDEATDYADALENGSWRRLVNPWMR